MKLTFTFAGLILFAVVVTAAFRAEDRIEWKAIGIGGPVREVNLLFVGDMFFDRHIRKMISKHGEDYIFSCIGDFLKGYDLVVGNLEGPITDSQSISLGSEVGSPNNFVFTFPTTTARLLARNNIKVVNLGNNHIGNFGIEGFESTKAYLKEADIKYFGGLNQGSGLPMDDLLLRKNIKGNKISFISYNQFGGDSVQDVVKKIEVEKANGNTVIVYTHWGEEYVGPSLEVREYAKMFADAGATLIIGSHPHVVLAHEEVGDAVVYYSLGNFIFDQYWEEAVRNGLALETRIQGDRITFTEHRIEMQPDGRTCLAE